jgi:hypothetical protein
MDYHHWKETYGTRFLCTCRPLSSTGRVLDWMARFSSLGTALTLSCRINNASTDKLNNEPNRRIFRPFADILRQTYNTPVVYQRRKHSLPDVALQKTSTVHCVWYSQLAVTGNQEDRRLDQTLWKVDLAVARPGSS